MKFQLKKLSKDNFERIYKVSLVLVVIVSFLLSAGNRMDIIEFRAQLKPIGQNPDQFNPSKMRTYELGTLHLHPSTGNDTLVGHNNTTGMLTRIAKSDLFSGYITSAQLTTALSGYATTASLSNYATVASLSGYVPTNRTLTVNGTTSDLTSNRSWSVGDLLSTGSYSNPTWISSLAYSKLTGSPANFVLTTTGTGAATYNSGTNALNIPTPITYTSGTGISISSGVISNTAPDQTVSIASGNRMSVTGTYPAFTAAFVEPTPVIVSRAVNTNFTISTTKQATALYAITCSTTNPLLVGTSVGTAFLEYSTNGGTTWLNPSQVSGSSGVGITVTVALTTGGTSLLAGVIPANALVRIRTTTSGTATVTYVTGQETY